MAHDCPVGHLRNPTPYTWSISLGQFDGGNWLCVLHYSGAGWLVVAGRREGRAVGRVERVALHRRWRGGARVWRGAGLEALLGTVVWAVVVFGLWAETVWEVLFLGYSGGC